jgi:hypothetical protein
MARASNTQVSEQHREQVRRVAAQLAGESTSVVHFCARSVIYRVPDRRRDGTPRGSDKAKRILRAVMLAPLAILTFPVIVILGALDDLGIQVPSRNQGKITVHGKASCAALSFADAVRGAEQDVWLAWSRSQVALLTMNGEHRPQVLWRATGHQRPKLKITKATLRWPDESRIDFDLTSAERARITEHQGTP